MPNVFHLISYFTADKHCFISLPYIPQFSSILSHHTAANPSQPIIVQLTWKQNNNEKNNNNKAYVAWNGVYLNLSPSESLQYSVTQLVGIVVSYFCCFFTGIPLELAKSLGIPSDLRISVEIVYNSLLTKQISVECVSADDWEILSLHSDYLELHLLEQVQIVTYKHNTNSAKSITNSKENETNTNKDNIFPFWVNNKNLIHLRLISTSTPSQPFARLGLQSEVIVAPNVRKIQSNDNKTESNEPVIVPPICKFRVQMNEFSEFNRDRTVYMNQGGLDQLKSKANDLVLVTHKTKKSENSTDSQEKQTSQAKIITNNIVVRIQLSESCLNNHILLPFTLQTQFSIETCSIVTIQPVYLHNANQIMKPIRSVRIKEVNLVDKRNNKATTTINPTAEIDVPVTEKDEKLASEQFLTYLRSFRKPIPIANGNFLSFKIADRLRYFTVNINDETEKPATNNQTTNSTVPPSQGHVTVRSKQLASYYLLSDPQQPVTQSLKPLPPLPLPLPIVQLKDKLTIEYSLAEAFNLLNKTIVPLEFIGGYSTAIQTICSYIESNLNPKLIELRCDKLNFQSAAGGLMLIGNSGYGKSFLLKSIAAKYCTNKELYAYIHYVECADLIGLKPAQFQLQLETIFSLCIARAPSLLILDDIDKLMPASGENEVNLQSHRYAEIFVDLLSSIRHFHPSVPFGYISSSQSVQSHHPSLSLTNIFNNFLALKPPVLDERSEMVNKSLAYRQIPVEEKLDWVNLAVKTEGYIGQDLQQLVMRTIHAAAVRLNNNNNNNNNNNTNNNNSLFVNENKLSESFQLIEKDFESALTDFVPSSLKDLPPNESKIEWSSIGGLEEVKQTLVDTLELPTKYGPLFDQIPLKLRSGLLLYGPSGCGKTLLASAVAHHCKLNFISVKGPELLNKYIGSSEQSVRDVFARARSASPCVLFFDEFESIAPKRGGDSTGVTDRVVNQFLCELDGVEGHVKGVYILAASSRPDLIDPALLRPGRLDKSLYCSLPTYDERRQILKAITSKVELASDVNLELIAQHTEHYSGADLQGLIANAQLEVIHETLQKELENNNNTNSKQTYSVILTAAHFEHALSQTAPSLSSADRALYKRIYSKFIASKEGSIDQSFDPNAKQRTALA